MDQKITTTSKQIIKVLLQQALRSGDLQVFLKFPYLMKELRIEDRNFMRICVLYLSKADYLRIIRSDNADTLFIEINPKAIDLVENTSVNN